MASQTSIEWTATVHPDGTVTPGSTWNPTRGCARVSEGCRNCYAEIMAARFSKPGQWGHGFAEMKGGDHRWAGKVELIESQLDLPLRWKRPRRIFVNSTSDLFHEALPDEAIDRVFAVMAICPRHTFQILTKRADRMRDYIRSRGKSIKPWEAAARLIGYSLQFNGHGLISFPLPNVWLGVSVEDQEHADERIPLLLETPAAVRFISAEPLLGPIDFWQTQPEGITIDWLRGLQGGPSDHSIPGLNWVIIGGESGPNSRPFNWEWGHNIMKQCAAAGVACFVKQYGSNPVGPLGSKLPLKDKKGGDWLEWPKAMRVRQFPKQGVIQ